MYYSEYKYKMSNIDLWQIAFRNICLDFLNLCFITMKADAFFPFVISQTLLLTSYRTHIWDCTNKPHLSLLN